MLKAAKVAVIAAAAGFVVGVAAPRKPAPAQAALPSPAETEVPLTRSVTAQKARMCLNDCHARTDLVLGAVLATMETPHAATSTRPSLDEIRAWVRESVRRDLRRNPAEGIAYPEGWE